MSVQKHNFFHYFATIFYFLVTRLMASIVWVLIALVGLFIISSGREAWIILFGLPLVLIGGGLLVNYLATIVFVIFDFTYNRGVCPICKPNNKD